MSKSFVVAVAVVAAVVVPGCSSHHDSNLRPAGAATSPAVADGSYCKIALQWAAHELTPYDQSKPSVARSYWHDYLAYVDQGTRAAPAAIASDLATNRHLTEDVLTPVLVKYGYSQRKIMTKGSAAERAIFNEPPPAGQAAQAEISAYESSVCGAFYPAPAQVHFHGSRSTGFCRAEGAEAAAVDRLSRGGWSPGAVKAHYTSAGFATGLVRLRRAAPPVIAADVSAYTSFASQQFLPTIGKYGYDLRKVLLAGSSADRHSATLSSAAIASHVARIETYEGTVCRL